MNVMTLLARKLFIEGYFTRKHITLAYLVFTTKEEEMAHLMGRDGVKLFYEDTGEGLPVVFGHEFAGDWRRSGCEKQSNLKVEIKSISKFTRNTVNRRGIVTVSF